MNKLRRRTKELSRYKGGCWVFLWLYNENNKLQDWKKCVYSTYSLWAPHTYDFVVLTSLTHPRKTLLVVLQIGKAKDLSAPLHSQCTSWYLDWVPPHPQIQVCSATTTPTCLVIPHYSLFPSYSPTDWAMWDSCPMEERCGFLLRSVKLPAFTKNATRTSSSPLSLFFSFPGLLFKSYHLKLHDEKVGT
jgi:hypothetical protein